MEYSCVQYALFGLSLKRKSVIGSYERLDGPESGAESGSQRSFEEVMRARSRGFCFVRLFRSARLCVAGARSHTHHILDAFDENCEPKHHIHAYTFTKRSMSTLKPRSLYGKRSAFFLQ